MKRTYAWILLALAGVPLLFINSQRIHINVQPDEGQTNATVLESQKEYTQTYTSQRRSLTSISFFLRPAVSNPISGNITLTVVQHGNTLATQSISAEVIDNESATRFTFTPPLSTTPDEPITTIVTVDDSLSAKVRMQHAQADNPDYTHTYAFEVYYGFRPPLAIQFGSILLLVGVASSLQLWEKRPIAFAFYALGISIVFQIPLIILGHFSIPLFAATTIAQSGMILLLQSYNLSTPAVLLGANVFALTTWFPLHTLAGRESLIAFALLPIIAFIVATRHTAPIKLRMALALFSVFFALLAALSPQNNHTANKPLVSANLKDIFLDPNQVPSSNKVSPGYLALQIPTGDPSLIEAHSGWDHFGSYIGPINLLLALIGIIAIRKHLFVAMIGLAGLLVAATPPLTNAIASNTPLIPQYLIILTTYAFAILAAQGLTNLRRFLGPDKLITALMYILVLFSLLDLLNVAGKTLQFNLL